MTDYFPAALRQQIYEQAHGQCEYCLIPQTAVLVSLQVDHIIARKHGGATTANNLALACPLCNKHKGSDLASIDPVNGAVTALFHPRRQQWHEHFYLQDGQILPLTATGRVTVSLLQLNRPERVAERQLLLAANAQYVPE